jgi:hypothetical protein
LKKVTPLEKLTARLDALEKQRAQAIAEFYAEIADESEGPKRVAPALIWNQQTQERGKNGGRR